MKMMFENSLTILGSSSGVPQANRTSSGYILKTKNRLSLFDCGGGVTQSYLKRGYDPLDVDRIFITHTHPDHVSDLSLFIQMILVNGREDPVDVYIPSEFVDIFNSYLRSVYVIKEKMPFELNIIGYEAGEVYNGDFKLTAVANKHLHKYSEYIKRLNLPNKMQCHSFDIEVGGKKIFYSADVGSFDDVKDYLDGHDIVIIESAHIDLEAFINFAKTAKIGQIVLTHFDNEAQVKEICGLASQAGLDNLVTAVDGLELSL